MNYPSVSTRQIIGRVIRRTGLKDTSLIPDIQEWIAEAMELMQTTVLLEHNFQTVDSQFHKAKYPCGMTELWAVEYCGTRLRHNNGVRDPRAGWTPPSSTPVLLEDAVFVSTTTRENTPSGNFLFTSEFQKVQNLKWNGTEWYKTDGRFVLTSFETGKITLFYGSVPTDEEGFLMIPGEGNYKEALTWFLQARLAGRGYPNPEMTMEQMDAKFETHSGRAIANITYPSVDQMQATTDTLARLIPNLNYYEDMFTTIGPEPTYGM